MSYRIAPFNTSYSALYIRTLDTNISRAYNYTRFRIKLSLIDLCRNNFYKNLHLSRIWRNISTITIYLKFCEFRNTSLTYKINDTYKRLEMVKNFLFLHFIPQVLMPVLASNVFSPFSQSSLLYSLTWFLVVNHAVLSELINVVNMHI
jgi:hypothetical protein